MNCGIALKPQKLTLAALINNTLGKRMPVTIKLNQELLRGLLRSNICCHLNKPLTEELIEELTQQIIDSIDYFLNNAEE